VPAPTAGPRVTLRPLLPHESDALHSWCPGYNGPSGELVAVLAGEALVGAIGYRDGEPAPDWCTFYLAVVRPERRGFGLGSEAVRAVEKSMAGPGQRHFRALVPLSMGLAFYFWLRLGYRPDGVMGEHMVMVRGAEG